MEKPERQPYIHWTTFYDFEETKNMELCSYTPPRPVRVYDLVDPESTTSSSTALSAAGDQLDSCHGAEAVRCTGPLLVISVRLQVR